MSKRRKSIKPASSACHMIGAAIRVTSWPATSSMTTCDGSFLPQPRASRVAAGIPMATESAISTRMTGKRAGAGRCEASSHQTSTVASDPHVPGPGRSRPTPRTVATRVAHRGAVERIPAGSVVLFGSLIRIVGIVGLRIVQRSRDYVAAACPFAQIDEPATLATERELKIAGQHDLSAGWAT